MNYLALELFNLWLQEAIYARNSGDRERMRCAALVARYWMESKGKA